jgi:hypothetical protein
MSEPVVESQDEFIKQTKGEFNRAWARDKQQIKERFEIGGRRLTHTQWLVIENCYKVGFYSGLSVKIEFVENNG